jgi:hypothetical protein
MRKNIVILAAVIGAVTLSGCGHNINVPGGDWLAPTVRWVMGLSLCTKDNVKVIATEETTKEGVKSTNEFIVGEQVTGYDVELAKTKK